jgi:hypothetical protein
VSHKFAARAGERFLLGCSAASLLVSCILWSARKQAWMDEIFTWKEVRDPSIAHLFSAIQHGADGGQPLFYITAWLWAKSFGATDLSLRLYSSVAVCAAFLVTWRCIRRVYGMWPTAFGVLSLWGTSGLLLDQNAEARFYGLFLLCVALAVLLYLQLSATPHPTWRLWTLNCLGQAALVFTHVLGIIYGALILAALLIFDKQEHRFRWKVYLSYAAGWLALLVWIPAIRASMAAGKPVNWIPIPTLHNLYDVYTYWIFLPWLSSLQAHANGLVFQTVRRALASVLLLPIITVVCLSLLRPRGAGRALPRTGETALLIVGSNLLAAPILLFVLSYALTPVFAPRYMLPSIIGMTIVLAAFFDWLKRQLSPSFFPALRWAALLPLTFLVSCPIASALLRGTASANWRFLDTQRVDQMATSGVPVVIGWQQDFSKLMRYSQNPALPYYFLLDWPAALAGPRPYVLDYHLMRAYRDAGYYSQNIEDSNAFLCAHNQFLVLDSHSLDPREAGTTWFDYSVRHNPRFSWRVLGSLDGPGVTRAWIAVRSNTPVPCQQP